MPLYGLPVSGGGFFAELGLSSSDDGISGEGMLKSLSGSFAIVEARAKTKAGPVSFHPSHCLGGRPLPVSEGAL